MSYNNVPYHITSFFFSLMVSGWTLRRCTQPPRNSGTSRNITHTRRSRGRRVAAVTRSPLQNWRPSPSSCSAPGGQEVYLDTLA